MLLKVKPDGPVYEVCLTSQLISARDNAMSISTTQQHTDSTSRMSVSRTISSTTVTSVGYNTWPVVRSVASVGSSRGQNIAAVTAKSSHVPKSSTQHAETLPLTYRDGQSVSGGVLSRDAVTNTANSVRLASSGPANTKALENFVTSVSSVQSDNTGSW